MENCMIEEPFTYRDAIEACYAARPFTEEDSRFRIHPLQETADEEAPF